MISSKTELFSFGSGSWKEGKDADASMQEVDGKWLNMQMCDANARVILEKKSLPDTITVKTEVPITLKELLLALETSGEVNVGINSHLVARDGVTFKVSRCASLAFLLDSKPTKKACLPCPLCFACSFGTTESELRPQVLKLLIGRTQKSRL